MAFAIGARLIRHHMESSHKECQLLVGPAAIAAQVLLVAIVVLGLFYKRCEMSPFANRKLVTKFTRVQIQGSFTQDRVSAPRLDTHPT